MSSFQFDIPPEVAEVIRHLHPAITRNIKQALHTLSDDPEAGEPLRRELAGLWKYRVRRYRIVYAIDKQQQVLRIVAVGLRREIYETVAERMHRPARK
jgi:mRNA interferase RelE/StbE